MGSDDADGRELMVRELYAANAKGVRPEWIAAVLRITGGLSMPEFIDACRRIEQEEEFPHNLGAAILKLAYEKRNNERMAYHAETKTSDGLPNANTCPAGRRYMNLLIRVLALHLDKAMYDSFWGMVNDRWALCKNNDQYLRCMDDAEMWEKELAA